MTPPWEVRWTNQRGQSQVVEWDDLMDAIRHATAILRDAAHPVDHVELWCGGRMRAQMGDQSQ